MAGNFVVVGMADLKIVRAPQVLTTIGLGSCVGIALYDPVTKIAGLAHIMLPESAASQSNTNPAKFADTATKKMLDEMVRMGAKKGYVNAKIAGGAQMFNFTSTNENLRVGDRNTEAAKRILQSLRIPLIAEETGSTFGRTMELYSEDGRVAIKAIGQAIRYL